MKKILLAITLIIASFGVLKAQDGLQLGANLGPTMGMSLKYNANAVNGFEMVLGYNIPHDGPSFKFMYEYHVALVDNLRMYFGGGFNIGALHLSNNKHNFDNGEFAFGIVPTIGVDYSFRGAPIAFAFGYEPAINVVSHCQWSDIAFKVRYRF
ncbi:MAG: hypothetical protein Q4F97_10830 [Bacteroidales bacterium]|nr:hypothetical protein [Bacteroidales bacterium]